MVKYIVCARLTAIKNPSNTLAHTHSLKFDFFYESCICARWCARALKRAQFIRSIELQLSNWHGTLTSCCDGKHTTTQNIYSTVLSYTLFLHFTAASFFFFSAMLKIVHLHLSLYTYHEKTFSISAIPNRIDRVSNTYCCMRKIVWINE